MPDRRGLRGKQRRDADDKARERTARERELREAALAAVQEVLDDLGIDVETLKDFKNRQAGFAGSQHEHPWSEINNKPAFNDHQHGADEINNVHWSAVGTGKSPVPNFAKQSDLEALWRRCLNKFKKA